MAFVGNLLWFIFGGGFIFGTIWMLFGLVWCCTIVGIPLGIACFRIGRFAYFPFGKTLVPAEMVGEERIAGTGIMNFLWCIFCGLWLSIGHAVVGLADCCIIVGIPFGLANFKLSAASFAPLGKRVMSSELAKAAFARDASAKVDAMFKKAGK